MPGRNKKAVTCNARFSQLSGERREANGLSGITSREKLSRARLRLRDRVATRIAPTPATIGPPSRPRPRLRGPRHVRRCVFNVLQLQHMKHLERQHFGCSRKNIEMTKQLSAFAAMRFTTTI